MALRLAKPLLSLMLMAPVAALALGLGEVKLHSALNQNLNADIELLSVEPGDSKELRVSLASSETFAKIGLPRPSVLMFVKFDVQQRNNGTYFIKATSSEAIREPFLDFLVEVEWPAGRVMREYTLLLDPPTRHTDTMGQVQAPTTGDTQRTAAPMQQMTAAPVEPAAVSSPMQLQPQPQPQAQQQARSQQQGAYSYYSPAQSQPAAYPGGVSYKVRRGDSLWEIALKLRPNKNISVGQMMLALLKANPHAFVDNNINRLKKGYVLRIDDPALYTAISKAEAVREVARQTREWQDYVEAVAGKASGRKTTAADRTPARSAASGKAEPKLKLVAPKGKGKNAGATGGKEKDGNVGELEDQLMLALESSAAQRKENEELQGRVDDLEAQLKDMQRLVTLQDTDMAALQKQLGDQAKNKDTAAAAKKQQLVEKPAAAEKKPAQKPVENKPAKPAEKKPAAKTKEPAKKPKPRVAPQPRPEPSFIDMLMEDQLMMMAGGGALVLLLLLVLIISRRRSKGGGFRESILTGGTSSMLNAASASSENRSETSFLSDLAISGMGGGSISADEGEVDPITEADVFMAYGRYQQAEEVLNKAMQAHPNRPDIAAKLLEVYFNTRDTDKFEQLLISVSDVLQADDEAWGSVASMGKQLLPDNPLFAEADTTSVTVEAPAGHQGASLDNVLDIGLDLDELSAEMEDGGGGSDFDLNLGDLDAAAETEVTMPAAEPMPEPVLEQPAEAAADLDFDLDLGEDADASVSAAVDSGELGSLDFDLSGGDDATAESAGGGLDDMEFGDLGDSAGGNGTDLAADAGGDFGALDSAFDGEDPFSDGDEISTKLDLAQAYIEMGDGEGARSMLDEIVAQGNAQQQQQAQELLSRI